MFTEYPKVLSFFKQAIHRPNIELKEILFKFAALKEKPDDITAANYLISSYHEYNAHIERLTANASVK